MRLLLGKMVPYIASIGTMSAIADYLGIRVPAQNADMVVILILMGAMLIWIDHNFERKMDAQ